MISCRIHTRVSIYVHSLPRRFCHHRIQCGSIMATGYTHVHVHSNTYTCTCTYIHVYTCTIHVASMYMMSIICFATSRPIIMNKRTFILEKEDTNYMYLLFNLFPTQNYPSKGQKLTHVHVSQQAPLHLHIYV